MAVYTGTVKGKDYSVSLPDDASPATITLALAREAGIIKEGFKGSFSPRKLGFERIEKEKASRAGAFLSAFSQIPLANFQEEAKAKIDTTLKALDRIVNGKKPLSKTEAEQAYRSSLKREQLREAEDWKKYPATGWTGTGTGIGASILATRGLAQMPKAGAPIRWATAPETISGKAIRGATLAIPGGAASGAGASEPGKRSEGALAGGIIAPAISFAAPYAGKPFGDLTHWAVRRFGPRNWTKGGWAKELSERLKGVVSPEEAAASAAAIRTAGVPAAPLDVTGRAGQDVIRSVAERPGSIGQPTLEREAIERAQQLPARTIQQARSIFTSSRLPGKTGEASPLALREELGKKRSRQFSAAIEPIRKVKLTLPATITDNLALPDLRAIASSALRFVKTDAEKAQLLRFRTELAEGKVKSPISLGAAEAIRRSLAKAEGKNTPSITAARQELSQFLETSSPKYAKAMQNYRIQSAIAGPGKLGAVGAIGKEKGEAIELGKQVLSGDPEKMALQQANLGGMDIPVEFRPPNLAEAVDITPRQAATEGALRAIEKQAGKPGGAAAVAESMALPEQQARNRLVMEAGPAETLEANLATEAARVEAANRAAPQAFQSLEAEKAGNALLSGAGLLSTSPVIQARGAGGLASILQRAGISKHLADRIAINAIDPAQTDMLIAEMRKAGIKAERAQEVLLGVRNLLGRGGAGFNAAAQRQQDTGATADLYGKDQEYDYKSNVDDEFDYMATGAIAAPKIVLEPAEGYISDVNDEYDYQVSGEQ